MHSLWAAGIALPLRNHPPYPAVFFDRDGTLMEDADYCRDPTQVAVFPDARATLRRLKAHGFRLFIVTNQSGIGRGYFTEEDYGRVQAEVSRQLGGDLIDAVYHCPDHPDHATERRKPGAGMILEAAADHGLDLPRSYLVGDHERDLEAGRRAGLAATVLVLTGQGREHLPRGTPDFVAGNLTAAADWILRDAEKRGHG